MYAWCHVQVASLKQEMGRFKKRENLMREQRDMWRSRAFKLELMCSGLQDDLSSAIQAAKTIVNQSETSVWNASPGPGDGDAVPWLDYDVAAQQEQQQQANAGSRFESSSREDPVRGARVSARPASAHPRTGSRLARPGSGRPKPSGSKTRPRSALPASGNYHTQAKGGQYDGINIRPAPPRPETGTPTQGRVEKDIAETYEDSDGTVGSQMPKNVDVGVVPTGGYMMSDPAGYIGATAVRQPSISIPEDTLGIIEDENEESSPQVSRDGAILSHLVEPQYRPSSQGSPEITIIGMGGEVTHMSRSVKTSQSSPSRQQYPQHRAQSARPASARPPISRGSRPSSVRTVSPSLSHTSPAQTPLPPKQRPVSAVPTNTMSSQKSSAGIVSRPHSALPSSSRESSTGRSSANGVRRAGQSASDFIRTTRTNYMYNGRPFS